MKRLICSSFKIILLDLYYLRKWSKQLCLKILSIRLESCRNTAQISHILCFPFSTIAMKYILPNWYHLRFSNYIGAYSFGKKIKSGMDYFKPLWFNVMQCWKEDLLYSSNRINTLFIESYMFLKYSLATLHDICYTKNL